MATQVTPEERVALGRAIAYWMKTNGISQQVPHDWAKATGQNGPWNSQISLLQRGQLDPKGSFWVSLAAFNQAVRDSKTTGCATRIAEIIKDAEPFLTSDGKPAEILDLFSMFLGLTGPNEMYLQGPAISEQEAAAFSRRCRQLFDGYMEEEMLTRKEAWAKLCEQLTVLPPVQSTLRKVLIGEDALSVEQLEINMDRIKEAYSALGLGL